jgi:hypothetical protein
MKFWIKILLVSAISVGIGMLIKAVWNIEIPDLREHCGNAVCYPVLDGLMKQPSWCSC